MSTCNHDALVALAHGESGADADAADAHAAECASCARELAWLRAESRLFARQAQPELPSHIWQSIERRLVIAQECKRRARQMWWRAGGVAALAAAVTLLIAWPRQQTPPTVAAHVKPTVHARAAAAAAFTGAERDYGAAIATLEAEYAAKRTRMRPEVAARYDAELAKMRETVDATRVATNDVPGRRQALRAYSAYMRSMQSIVLGGDQ